MSSQWHYLLHNLGSWHGYFIKLSACGEERSRQGSCTTLEGLDDHQTIRQTVQVGDRVRVLEYSHLARSVLVLPNGAFSQGSTQYTPVGEFGAELGLIHRLAAIAQRLRLVLLFQQSELQEITLIPEHLPDSAPINPDPINPQTIPKAWQGESLTLYTDWRSPTTAPCVYEFSSLGLLLPYHAIAQFPNPIPHRTPFSLSLLWLAEPDLLYCLSRRYDQMGGWTDLTLCTLRPR